VFLGDENIAFGGRNFYFLLGGNPMAGCVYSGSETLVKVPVLCLF